MKILKLKSATPHRAPYQPPTLFVVSLVEFPNRFGTSKHVGDHKVINSWPFIHHNVELHRLCQENGVDGRNPAPVDRWLSHYLYLFIGFQPSKVVQDFFHPPYVSFWWSCYKIDRTGKKIHRSMMNVENV